MSSAIRIPSEPTGPVPEVRLVSNVTTITSLAMLMALVLAFTACGTGIELDVADNIEQDVTPSTGVRIEIIDPSSAAATGNESAATAAKSIQPLDGGVGDVPPNHSLVAHATVTELTAKTGPDIDAATAAEFTNPTPSGAPLVFRVIDIDIGTGTGTDADADADADEASQWIQVQLPIQPNGTTGWVLRSDVELFDNPYRVEIDRSHFSLKVFERNKLWLETIIAVGTGATPTPVGDFYLVELLAPPDADGPYGPFAFGLSGFSEVLTSFGEADVAIIGIHGTNDPASLGTEVSHGCVRLENAAIKSLAAVLPLGTPVRIT